VSRLGEYWVEEIGDARPEGKFVFSSVEFEATVGGESERDSLEVFFRDGQLWGSLGGSDYQTGPLNLGSEPGVLLLRARTSREEAMVLQRATPQERMRYHRDRRVTRAEKYNWFRLEVSGADAESDWNGFLVWLDRLMQATGLTFDGPEATTIVDAVLALTAPLIEWARVEDRESVADAVWAMYETSYARIGLIASGPAQLLAEYDAWWVAHEGDVPRAFRVAKTTPFGLKIGLSGTDGSREGRTFLKATMGGWLNEPGVYCEVSHRMEDLAREGGAPAVCSTDAPNVLRKPVIPVDAVHYQRNIEPIGMVTKVIVGRPLSVPVTSFELPSCPKHSSSERLSGFGSEASDRVDLLETLDSLMPWED